jgi:hypothetical protein
MARSRYALTPEVARLIVSYVRAGGYPHVAAEAAGVPREVFEEWLRRGEERGGRPPFREFRRDLLQAHAQARLKAEVAALEDRPLDWLKFGPGKETAAAGGWTGLARPRPAAVSPGGDPFADPAARAFIHFLLEQLGNHPELRATIARQLEEQAQPMAGNGRK